MQEGYLTPCLQCLQRPPASLWRWCLGGPGSQARRGAPRPARWCRPPWPPPVGAAWASRCCDSREASAAGRCRRWTTRVTRRSDPPAAGRSRTRLPLSVNMDSLRVDGLDGRPASWLSGVERLATARHRHNPAAGRRRVGAAWPPRRRRRTAGSRNLHHHRAEHYRLAPKPAAAPPTWKGGEGGGGVVRAAGLRLECHSPVMQALRLLTTI